MEIFDFPQVSGFLERGVRPSDMVDDSKVLHLNSSARLADNQRIGAAIHLVKIPMWRFLRVARRRGFLNRKVACEIRRARDKCAHAVYERATQTHCRRCRCRMRYCFCKTRFSSNTFSGRWRLRRPALRLPTKTALNLVQDLLTLEETFSICFLWPSTCNFQRRLTEKLYVVSKCFSSRKGNPAPYRTRLEYPKNTLYLKLPFYGRDLYIGETSNGLPIRERAHFYAAQTAKSLVYKKCPTQKKATIPLMELPHCSNEKAVRLELEDHLIILFGATLNTLKRFHKNQEIIWQLTKELRRTDWEKIRTAMKRDAKETLTKRTIDNGVLEATEKNVVHLREILSNNAARQEIRDIRCLTRQRADVPREVSGRLKLLTAPEMIARTEKARRLLNDAEMQAFLKNVKVIRKSRTRREVLDLKVPFIDGGRVLRKLRAALVRAIKPTAARPILVRVRRRKTESIFTVLTMKTIAGERECTCASSEDDFPEMAVQGNKVRVREDDKNGHFLTTLRDHIPLNAKERLRPSNKVMRSSIMGAAAQLQIEKDQTPNDTEELSRDEVQEYWEKNVVLKQTLSPEVAQVLKETISSLTGDDAPTSSFLCRSDIPNKLPQLRLYTHCDVVDKSVGNLYFACPRIIKDLEDRDMETEDYKILTRRWNTVSKFNHGAFFERSLWLEHGTNRKLPKTHRITAMRNLVKNKALKARKAFYEAKAKERRGASGNDGEVNEVPHSVFGPKDFKFRPVVSYAGHKFAPWIKLANRVFKTLYEAPPISKVVSFTIQNFVDRTNSFNNETDRNPTLANRDLNLVAATGDIRDFFNKASRSCAFATIEKLLKGCHEWFLVRKNKRTKRNERLLKMRDATGLYVTSIKGNAEEARIDHTKNVINVSQPFRPELFWTIHRDDVLRVIKMDCEHGYIRFNERSVIQQKGGPQGSPSGESIANASIFESDSFVAAIIEEACATLKLPILCTRYQDDKIYIGKRDVYVHNFVMPNKPFETELENELQLLPEGSAAGPEPAKYIGTLVSIRKGRVATQYRINSAENLQGVGSYSTPRARQGAIIGLINSIIRFTNIHAVRVGLKQAAYIDMALKLTLKGFRPVLAKRAARAASYTLEDKSIRKDMHYAYRILEERDYETIAGLINEYSIDKPKEKIEEIFDKFESLNKTWID